MENKKKCAGQVTGKKDGSFQLDESEKKRHHGSHRVFEYHDHSKSRCSSQITASHCSSIRSIYKLRQKRGAARLTDGKATKIETKEKNQIAEIFCY